MWHLLVLVGMLELSEARSFFRFNQRGEQERKSLQDKGVSECPPPAAKMFLKNDFENSSAWDKKTLQFQ